MRAQYTAELGIELYQPQRHQTLGSYTHIIHKGLTNTMSESPRKKIFNQGDEHSKREGASIRNTALTQPCKLQPRSLVSPLSLVPIMTLSPPDPSEILPE